MTRRAQGLPWACWTPLRGHATTAPLWAPNGPLPPSTSPSRSEEVRRSPVERRIWYSSSFRELIEEKAVYVDKTDVIHRLVRCYKCTMFLRPRRFGKSLLVSTLDAFFQGEKDLFRGLKIERMMEQEATDPYGVTWKKHPVLSLDAGGCSMPKEFEELLRYRLKQLYAEWGCNGITPEAFETKGIGILTRTVVKDLCAAMDKMRRKGENEDADVKVGEGVVVLVDEYDSPFSKFVIEEGNTKEYEEWKNLYISFFGTIKSLERDGRIRFVFVTGITYYSGTGISSAMNFLQNRSLDADLATMCGRGD